MLYLITALLAAIRVFFRNRVDTSLEVLALRQQVAVLKRKRARPSTEPPRPLLLDHAAVHMAAMVGCSGPCETGDRGRLASLGLSPVLALAIAAARRPAEGERGDRTLIRRMAAENADWGAPKIHGELLKLGVEVSERTVARYLQRLRRRGDPAKRWLAFLANHREVIVAFDFFTVPTLTFQLLFCFFVIESMAGAGFCIST